MEHAPIQTVCGRDSADGPGTLRWPGTITWKRMVQVSKIRSEQGGTACDTGSGSSPVAGSSVASDLAAVDVQDLTGNERRRLQKEDAVDDVADLPHVSYRRELRAKSGVTLCRLHRRLDDPWRDSVYPDAAGGVLDGQRLGGRGQAAFGQRRQDRRRARVGVVCQG